MKLMTKTLEKRFAQVGRQEDVKDPIVLAHFFNPTGVGDWYATEYDPVNRIIFGYAVISGGTWENEWGYTSMYEMEATQQWFGPGIERDLYWKEKPASAVIPGFTGF